MGVAGCGKTTVGLALAGELGCRFYDGDDYQPAENVAKMAGSIPLSDEDRIPWLRRLHSLIQEHLTRGETAVLACSALKRQYRDLLRSDLGGVTFVHLHGDFDLFAGRLRARPAHYMKADMLQSQFDTLEAPGPGAVPSRPPNRSRRSSNGSSGYQEARPPRLPILQPKARGAPGAWAPYNGVLPSGAIPFRVVFAIKGFRGSPIGIGWEDISP
jgi:gluconokinase